MIQEKLVKKIVLGLTSGTLKKRVNFLSNQDVIKTLDILTIKIIFQKMVDKAKKENDYEATITLLQALSYSSHKSKYKTEIDNFVFNKLQNGI